MQQEGRRLPHGEGAHDGADGEAAPVPVPRGDHLQRRWIDAREEETGAEAGEEGQVVAAARGATGASQGIGLRAGDIIHSFNRLPIVSVEALKSAMDGLKPGSPVALQVERDGGLQYVTFEME